MSAETNIWEGVVLMENSVTCSNCQTEINNVSPVYIVSNVRKFGNQKFPIWRCPACSSIHCETEISGPELYRNYPVHLSKADRFLRTWARKLAKLGRFHGVGKASLILDYGCGGGGLLQCLKESGFINVHGFDPYTQEFNKPSVLENKYDLVYCIEVIEHVAEPIAMLRTLRKLVRPGGLLILSTPRAEGIDLQRWWLHQFPLHAPYHQHIFSEACLAKEARANGFDIVYLRRNFFMFSWRPFFSEAFVNFFLSQHENKIDAFYERLNLIPLILKLRFWTYGLFGGLIRTQKRDAMLIVFRAR